MPSDRLHLLRSSAFNGLKAALDSGVVLQHPDWSQDFHVEADASIYGLGACLVNKPRDGKGPGRVLQFASRALGKHEKNYGQTELEGLAVVCQGSVPISTLSDWAEVHNYHGLSGPEGDIQCRCDAKIVWENDSVGNAVARVLLRGLS